MNGFKNAPSVDKFAVGMRVYSQCYGWLDVVAVDADGDARAYEHEHKAMHLIGPEHIGELDIDLDSVWVGREYRAMHGLGKNHKVVSLSPDGRIITYERGSPIGLRVALRSVFLGEHNPLPLSSPAASEPVKEGWKPEVGKECLAADGKKVLVMELWRCWAWVVVQPNGEGYAHAVTGLSPLPPEPPVKVGEYAFVTQHPERCGRIDAINPTGRSVRFWGSDGWVDWQAITHLVPVETA